MKENRLKVMIVEEEDGDIQGQVRGEREVRAEKGQGGGEEADEQEEVGSPLLSSIATQAGPATSSVTHQQPPPLPAPLVIPPYPHPYPYSTHTSLCTCCHSCPSLTGIALVPPAPPPIATMHACYRAALVDLHRTYARALAVAGGRSRGGGRREGGGEGRDDGKEERQ